MIVLPQTYPALLPHQEAHEVNFHEDLRTNMLGKASYIPDVIWAFEIQRKDLHFTHPPNLGKKAVHAGLGFDRLV
jgi:hypothetical protein